MRREEMEQLLVGYLYGELSPEERARVEERLGVDREWAQTFEEMRATSGVLRRWEADDPGVRFVFTLPLGNGTGNA